MSRKLLTTSILLCAIMLVWDLAEDLLEVSGQEELRNFLTRQTSTDAETTLAYGKRIEFTAAGIYEIELIPNISDTLAIRLIEKKAAIIAKSNSLPTNEKHRSYELVRGIGPKTAEDISTYMRLPGESSFPKIQK